MNRIAIRFAAAALLGLAATQGALAADAGLGYAYVGGTGENESVAYAGATPQGVLAAPATITGSGENVSVDVPHTVLPGVAQYNAVVDGSGENQSVRYVPVAPRG
ncbi:hypothetical protein KPL78_21630 [Roseomonas sp. HJA6]|uniref:Uncharacterized protein n=1 Tax=Roseomonas alba TaxID=2846776 RepID=A0ABS7AGL5_9PROT|nr:hypothetical protein [Neoroseomonas alba]MBW6400475.1 hypothetical protein [Neoroseomonas alba]